MPVKLELDRRYNNWQAKRLAIQHQQRELQTFLQKERENHSDIKSAIQLLQYIVQETTKENEETAATLATLALQETFTDMNLALQVDHENYRGQPGVSFKLRDEDENIEGDPLESFGGGPASLIGFILQVISVVRQPNMSRVLVLDEPFVHVSQAYQDSVSRLLRKICDTQPRGLGFKMLVITHLESIAAAANKHYRATKTEKGLKLELTPK